MLDDLLLSSTTTTTAIMVEEVDTGIGVGEEAADTF
jgi:hypothetical protein